MPAAMMHDSACMAHSILTLDAVRSDQWCVLCTPSLAILPTRCNRSTLFLHSVCRLRECKYGECAHEQHLKGEPPNPNPNPNLNLTPNQTLTHTLMHYSVSKNDVCAYSSVQLDKRRVERVYRCNQLYSNPAATVEV